jgi:adenosylcobinamide-phosphate synthase
MLVGLNSQWLALLFSVGVFLDLLLGEVRRWHPLVGFGRLASFIEKRFNQGRQKFLRGMLGWTLAVMPVTLLLYWCIGQAGNIHPLLEMLLHPVLLYFCLGLRSLHDHTAPIEAALQKGDLQSARELTSRIVSRDTGQAQPGDLAKAGVESLLENGNDAVFGTLFWFAIAGGPGAVLFRLANTLDAMWGYRTERFLAFGCTAARIDDVLNWIPARLTALSYAFLGNTTLAWQCWRSQAPQWSSPNAGPVMASGAGALEIALGGAAVYGGILEERPILGSGHAAGASDIGRAWRLVWHAAALWLGVAVLIACVVWLSGGAHA